MRIRTIGIIVNERKREAFPVLRECISRIREQGLEPALQKGGSFTCPGIPSYPTARFLKYAQALLTFGGDGTLLGAARLAGTSQIPMLGVNTGGLGFMTGITLDELPGTIEQLKKGDYTAEKRLMLKVVVRRQGRVIKSFTVLNDLVINRGRISRLINLAVSAGTDLINTYLADGLIIATPTGSTAYSLSAGGPILQPCMEAVVLNPICPHSLAERPMILSADETLTVRIEDKRTTVRLTLDGQIGFPLQQGDAIRVSRAPYSARLITFKDRPIYSVLRSKLNWGIRKGKT